MRFHWQNLSDEPGKERHGWWHGRAWLRSDNDRWPRLHVEWSHGRVKAACTLDIDKSDRELLLHVALPGFSYFLGVEGLPRRLFELLPMQSHREKYGGWERQIGWRIFDDAIWLSLWDDPMDWRSSDPKWWKTTIRVKDLILGKSKYERREIESMDVVVPMPEKTYPAKAKREVATWIRPRWPWRPFSTRRMTVDIEIPGGIGVPGKGENDYDIGPDAVYSQSSAADSIEEAIGNLVASVFRTRRKRGGRFDAVE